MRHSLETVTKRLRNASGMTLIEIVIVTGIMGVSLLAMMTLQQNQVKANNFLEFQLRRSQIESILTNQVFADGNNCKCMFQGSASFPATPGAPGVTIGGATPTQLGRYSFVTPGVCATATMPDPLVSAAGVENVKLVSAQLKNVIYISPGSYSANFVASIQTTKSVNGPNQIQIKIPVAVSATTAGPTATLSSCGMTVTSTAKGCRFCANFCGNGYPTDSGIIAAHWKDWDYVYTYANGCTGSMNWDISNRVHLCCAN